MAELERQRVPRSRSSPGKLAPAPAYCKVGPARVSAGTLVASSGTGGEEKSPQLSRSYSCRASAFGPNSSDPVPFFLLPLYFGPGGGRQRWRVEFHFFPLFSLLQETASDDAGGLHRSPPGGSPRLGPGVPGEIGQEEEKAGKVDTSAVDQNSARDWIQRRRASNSLFAGYTHLPCVCHFKKNYAILFNYSGLLCRSPSPRRRGSDPEVEGAQG